MRRRFNFSNAMTVFCAAILVGTEILAAALSIGWALGGMLDWSDGVTYSIIAICLIFGLYLIMIFLKKAMQVEKIFL